MKICYNQATMMKHSTLELDLEFCEQHGYDLIEIRIDMLKDYLTRHTADELAAFFSGSHLKPYAFNGLECINYRNAADYAAIKADLAFVCGLADKLHCHMVTMDPSFDVGHLTIGEIQTETVNVICDLAAAAEPFGVKLAFEFIGHPQCCINTFGQGYNIVQAVNRSDVGLILDLFHFHAMGSSLDDLRRADLDKIFMVHINDVEDLPRGSCTDSDRLWPGEGAIDTDAILRILCEKGYDGVYSLELFRPEYWEMDIEQAIQTGYDKTAAVLHRYY